jgi:hypothetical protein
MLFFLTKNEFAKIRNLFWNNEHISFQKSTLVCTPGINLLMKISARNLPDRIPGHSKSDGNDGKKDNQEVPPF